MDYICIVHTNHNSNTLNSYRPWNLHTAVIAVMQLYVNPITFSLLTLLWYREQTRCLRRTRNTLMCVCVSYNACNRTNTHPEERIARFHVRIASQTRDYLRFMYLAVFSNIEEMLRENVYRESRSHIADVTKGFLVISWQRSLSAANSAISCTTALA